MMARHSRVATVSQRQMMGHPFLLSHFLCLLTQNAPHKFLPYLCSYLLGARCVRDKKGEEEKLFIISFLGDQAGILSLCTAWSQKIRNDEETLRAKSWTRKRLIFLFYSLWDGPRFVHEVLTCPHSHAPHIITFPSSLWWMRCMNGTGLRDLSFLCFSFYSRSVSISLLYGPWI